MQIFHISLLLFQFAHLFFYFRFQHILLETSSILPLYVAIFISFFLIIVFIFSPLQNKISKTVISSVYFIYIMILSYLYFSFFNFYVGHDNIEYLLFFLSLIYFIYYTFSINYSSVIFVHFSLIFIIYFEYFLDRLNNYILFNDNILFFSAFFDNENINFNFFNLISSINFSFIFYFIFFIQFIFLFFPLFKNKTILILLISISICSHLFLMFLFNNAFYHLTLIFLLISLFVPVFLEKNIFYFKDKEALFIVSFIAIIFIISNFIYFNKHFSQNSFDKNSSLESINFEKHKKFITFSDNMYPLYKFNYFQTKSLYEHNKGIFSSRYIKVFWKNKLIFSNLTRYNDSYINLSIYDNLLFATFNHLYKNGNPKANKIFYYLFDKFDEKLTVEQGYLFLTNINNKNDIHIKELKTTYDYPENIDLTKDNFNFIIRDNRSNPDFIFVE